MTTKHVVADDVLGKISRRIWELMRRILEGSTEPNRALFYLQQSLEGVPRPQSSYKNYLLESRWSWDGSHREFATVCLEPGDSEATFEDVLNPLIPEKNKRFILTLLKEIYDTQTPAYDGHKMLRVYQVLGRNFLGYSPGSGIDGTLNSNTVHLNFVLKPLFDFNDMGNPIPCKIKN